MKTVFDLVCFAEVILVFLMMWEVYVKKVIRTFAISSYVIAFFLIFNGIFTHEYVVLLTGIMTFFVRGILIPSFMLGKLKKDTWREREINPPMGIASSIIVSLAVFVIGYVLYRFSLQSFDPTGSISIPLSLLFQGIFMMISRKNAFIQLIGYMVMENSILLLSSYIFPGLPFIVEGGVVLDLLGIVMISGLIMRIRTDLVVGESEDSDELKG